MLEKSRLLQVVMFGLMSLTSYAIYQKYYSQDNEVEFEPFTKGYSLEGVVIRTSDESGTIISTIESPSMVHFADTETSVIESPKYTLHESTGDWIFTAKKGEINKGQTAITFPDRVDLYLDSNSAEQITINTSNFVVDINERIGRTQEKITMIQPGALITGIGSVISFNDHEIEITEDMYAEFKN